MLAKIKISIWSGRLPGTLLLLMLSVWGSFALAQDSGWETLEEGVESATFALANHSNSTTAAFSPANLAVLRLDPAKVEFDLLMASEHGEAKTLLDWAHEYDLVAAINASMYLPDKLTSTGYMRRGEHVNSSRIVNSFGAFFVAGPDDEKLPSAALLDRKLDNWEELLSRYKIVIQNFRMMNPDGLPLWGGTTRLFSIAAVAQDNEGRILFLHAAQPMLVNDFVNGVMGLDLNIERLMYVEGGHQAAMLVNAGDLNQVWTGRLASFMQEGSLVPLPNVLGVKRKKAE